MNQPIFKEEVMEYLKRQIEKHRPYNEQEINDKKIMLDFITQYENVLTRQNELAHFTASAWVFNKAHTKVLMIYHNIYKSWSWTGGHADGEADLLAVAIREVQEETGIQKVVPIKEDIFSLEIITVDGHVKRGQYVSSHLHINVTYLLEADEAEALEIKADENSGVKWFAAEEAVAASNEPWMRGIYEKLMKLAEIELKNA